jgi:hypothetical protein
MEADLDKVELRLTAEARGEVLIKLYFQARKHGRKYRTDGSLYQPEYIAKIVWTEYGCIYYKGIGQRL